MKKIKVLNYSIFIGQGLVEKISSLVNIARYSKAVIVTDKNIPQSLVKKAQNSLAIENDVLQIDSGEQYKNIDSVQQIWKKLTDFGCDRKSLVINIGGGLIGDIGGFAASTFMRGIAFLQIPTTLLAQVDASVGGKVGINFLGIKNLVGSFQQPVAVIIDIDTLTTLPPREFISGFAEIIKQGLIADKKYFQFVISKKPQDFSQDELIKIIEKSCHIKVNIVSADEKENGPRKLLNFGHTIGHAVESLSQNTNHPLLHGEAIGIGMIIEGKISKDLGLLSDQDYQILENSIARAGLPTFSDISKDEILEKIKSDKKAEKGQVKWTLLRGISQGVYDQIVEQSVIKAAL